MNNRREYERLLDAAERLHLSAKTLRRHIARGTITGYRIGRLIYVDPNEIDTVLVQTLPSVRRA